MSVHTENIRMKKCALIMPKKINRFVRCIYVKVVQRALIMVQNIVCITMGFAVKYVPTRNVGPIIVINIDVIISRYYQSAIDVVYMMLMDLVDVVDINVKHLADVIT